MQAVPGYAHAARQQTSAPGLKSGSVVALYRDPCASAHLSNPAPGLKSGHLESLYRDRART
jgi:hypothetical protein